METTDWVVYRVTPTDRLDIARGVEWDNWEEATNYQALRRYALVARVPTREEAERLVALTKEVDDGRKD